MERTDNQFPELIPFLPLNITIFAEGDQAILVASHPRMLEAFFPAPGLLAIMDGVRESK
ncbi:hypothetical protein [Sulfuriferula plumbiphila]|nr:hypothetical protein [Sulfuriferula plumbiphila]